MSAPFAVLVYRTEGGRRVDAYGPFDQTEAEGVAERLRRDYGLETEVVLLRGWTK